MKYISAAIAFTLLFFTAPTHAKLANSSPEYKQAIIRRIYAQPAVWPNGIRACREFVVIVQFQIDRDGALKFTRIWKSSGHAGADKAAIMMVQRAQPFPPPPQIRRNSTFELPINFRSHHC
jgi:protein TonB